jgi:DNA invertase Pin-like site-specific DNA recombinase
MCMMNFDRPIAVAYYRVSTQKQGRSGLGLDAQQAAVEAFCNARGLTLDSSFTEVESGKRTDRTELARAFARARRVRGVVAIAKLDRLARDVHFIAGLVKTGQAFACVDAPDDDAFMLHVRASVAEDEARKISKRTKEALAAAKARGKKLGNPQNLTDAGRARGSRTGAATMKARGRENREVIRDAVLDARQRGLSLRAIAKEVGCGAMTVSRILAEAEVDA